MEYAGIRSSHIESEIILCAVLCFSMQETRAIALRKGLLVSVFYCKRPVLSVVFPIRQPVIGAG